MKKIFYFISVIILLTAAYSCSNFEDLNTNPDASTVVSSDMIATQILKDTYRFWNPNPTDFATGNLWNKHIAVLETNANPYQYYYSYWPYGGFDSYANVTGLQKMVEFSKGTIVEPSYQGLALFLKAWYGFNATLDMGDVPYSEVGKMDEGIRYPKYDKQEDVVTYILEDLKNAEENFANGKDFKGDIMMDGKVVKWRRLCNSMQLKVIQTFGKKATAAQKARFAEIVSANNIMQSNDDNFSLKYSDNQNSWHPFSNNGEDRRKVTSLAKLTVDVLKKFNDRRLFYFAEPAAALITAGKTESEFAAYEGAPTELAAEPLAINNQAGQYSLINKRYVEIHAGDPMLILTYAEQCFILAEAVEEGWISGTAKTYYENGVKASLSYYKSLSSAPSTYLHGMAITDDYISNYFTGDAAYAVSGTKTDRLHQIWLQRWLIDFFQGNGGKYYFQFLRTGYPEFPLDANTCMNPDGKTYPKRWMYPTTEQTTNPENYKKAIDEQYNGYDGINQVPWWLK
ncbi:putative lipoprotein [uncultured Paludibacter sp.]|uniref:Putative lipoprotein n=1 Tax=uncultured Paludibacter sp. TaxID=497635 RepID=A0A653A6R6_9BACT|nr:putative lipoprotein [uncultured Paludibacter sp.]